MSSLTETQQSLIAVGVTAIAAFAIDQVVKRRAESVMRHLPGDEAAIRTRWRSLRRLNAGLIVVVGVALALTIPRGTRELASGILASSAVLAVIVGFAAQSTLGNLLAGVMLSFSQPLRLGDRVTIDGTDGIVEEIGLSYTRLASADGTRTSLPNALVASKVIANATARDGTHPVSIRVEVPVTVDWQPIGVQLSARARDLQLDGVDVGVVAVLHEGSIVGLHGRAATAIAAVAAELELRGVAATLIAEGHA